MLTLFRDLLKARASCLYSIAIYELTTCACLALKETETRQVLPLDNNWIALPIRCCAKDHTTGIVETRVDHGGCLGATAMMYGRAPSSNLLQLPVSMMWMDG